MTRTNGRNALAVGLLALVAHVGLTACAASDLPPVALGAASAATGPHEHEEHHEAFKPAGATGVVTLAFAGDTHFQLHLATLLEHPRGALGPIQHTLAAADVTMVNLETSITQRGVRLHLDYAFRTSPAALDVLQAAGVDVVTMANNHGVDYGPVGLADTLRAVRNSPIPVIGIGRNQAAAFTPYRVSIRGTDLAFFGASAEPDQLRRSAARPNKPGIAAAPTARPRVLLAAVRAASERGDVVVVYLHWGKALQPCPTQRQRLTAEALAEAGADVIVGSSAHVLLGSGWMGDTYVNYGLGNFLWYHNNQPESGVLRLRVRDGAVVGDAWTPALIETYGRPLPLRGKRGVAAVDDWRRLRGCTGLSARPPS